MMNFCTRCGSKLALSAKFCGTCGYPVSRVEENKDNITATGVPLVDNSFVNGEVECEADSAADSQPTNPSRLTDIGAYGFLEAFKEENDAVINPIDKWNEAEADKQSLADKIKSEKEIAPQEQALINEFYDLPNPEMAVAQKYRKKLAFRVVLTCVILSVLLFAGIKLASLFTPSENEVPFVFVSNDGYLKAYTTETKSPKIIDEYKEDVVFEGWRDSYFSLANSPLKSYGTADYYKISHDCEYITYISNGELKLKNINRVLNPLPFLKPETKTVSSQVKTLFDISFKGRYIVYSDESNVIKYYDKNKEESFTLFENNAEDLSDWGLTGRGQNFNFNFIKEDYLVIYKNNKLFIADLKKSGKAENVNENQNVDINRFQLDFEKDGSLKYIDFIQTSNDYKIFELASIEFKGKSYEKRIVAEKTSEFKRIGDYLVYSDNNSDLLDFNNPIPKAVYNHCYIDYKGEKTDLGGIYYAVYLDVGLDYPLILCSLEKYNADADKDYRNPDLPSYSLALTHFYSFETGKYHELMAGEKLKFLHQEEISPSFVTNKKKDKLYFFDNIYGMYSSDAYHSKDRNILKFDISKKGWLSNAAEVNMDKIGDVVNLTPLFGYTKNGDDEYMLAYENQGNYNNVKIFQGYEKQKLLAEGAMVDLEFNPHLSETDFILVLDNQKNSYDFYTIIHGVKKIASLNTNEIKLKSGTVQTINTSDNKVFLLVKEDSQYNLYIVKGGKKVLVEKNISYSQTNG